MEYFRDLRRMTSTDPLTSSAEAIPAYVSLGIKGYNQSGTGSGGRKPPSSMLTISEACRVLNVHANTLRRWSARGLVKEYRIGLGGHRRYKDEDIAALIVEQGPKKRQTT